MKPHHCAGETEEQDGLIPFPFAPYYIDIKSWTKEQREIVIERLERLAKLLEEEENARSIASDLS